ncbi:putative reverse transcriptase domain-containing protein [Tanacetum coccineum]
MPLRRLKKKSVKRLVEKRVAKAIEEYEKTRVIPSNASGSGPTNTGGTVNVHGCTHQTFINGKPYPFNGIEGVVGLRRWIEKVEQVFEICKCAEEDKVMFAASTFEGCALTWWNGNVHTLGLVNANRIPWTEFKSMMTTEYCPATEIQRMEEELWTLTLKGDDIEAYNNRFHELALMCPDLVPNEKKKVERYIKGFPERIKGNITSARPTTLHDAINLTRELVEQAVQGKAARNRRQETTRAYAAAPAEGKGYAGTLPKCNRCNLYHNGQCPPKCRRCQKLGHQEMDCGVRLPGTGDNHLRNVTCYGCGESFHAFRLVNGLHFITDPIKIIDHNVKQQKQSRISIVRIRWNSRQGAEYTWEREDQFRKKYPHLFTKPVPSIKHEDASDTGAAPKQKQQVIPQTIVISNIKLPILKKEEYDIWAMGMEHYLEYIDNDVWKVIRMETLRKRISTGKVGCYSNTYTVTAQEFKLFEKEREGLKISCDGHFQGKYERFHGMDDAKRNLGKPSELGFGEMDINWQIAMIAIRYEDISIRKLEGRSSWNVQTKGIHDGKKRKGKRRDSFYQHQEARKQEKNQMGLLTMDDGIVNWGEHTEDEETNHALMAISSSSEANEIYEKDEKLKKYRRIGMKAVKEKEQLQKTLDSWKDSSKNLWRLINSSMSSNSKVGLGYKIQSDNDVLSYEEEMNFSIFNCIEDDSVGKPLYSRFIKTNDFKGVPHPLSGDYTPTPQEEIDESFVGSIGTSTEHSFDPESEISRVPKEVYMSKPLTTNAQGEGYSFKKKKCFVCGSLSHLIKDCDYSEKKMAREAEVKKQRVFNTGNMLAKPVWTNTDRINHANQFVPRPVQLNTRRPNINSVRSNINTGRININSVRPRVNTVNSNVNIVRSRQPVPIRTSNSFGPKRPQDHPLKNMVDRGIFDSGCSGHMTGNKDQLDDFEEFNGGSVTFGGSKGYITGKGRIRVGNLDFDSVSFVKELGHFNLFSISQICDKHHGIGY